MVMNILNASQLKDWDNYTIKNKPISSIELMNYAALQCVEWIEKKYSVATPVIVVCGQGNNGGDGLVISRELKLRGYIVNTYVLNCFNSSSSDFELQLELLNDTIFIDTVEELKIVGESIIIDAILGSGLSRVVDGFIKQIIHSINEISNDVISIDIPSGMFIMGNSELNFNSIVKANYTLTFQELKYAFLFPDSYQFTGQVEVLDIGLLYDFLDFIKVDSSFITKNLVSSYLKTLPKFSHKGSVGRLLLICGSDEMYGAAVLCASSAVNSGVGYVVVNSTEKLRSVLAITVPEVVFESDDFILSDQFTKYRGVAIGPGLGTSRKSLEKLEQVLTHCDIPLVIDADAINLISLNLNLLKLIPENSIFTPHPKELERLLGEHLFAFEGVINQMKEFCFKYNVIILLKGAHTKVCFPNGKVYFNTTGNPGMSKAGMGDVLTGLLGSLISQGYSPKEAVLLAVYWHGFSADTLVLNKKITEEGVTPTSVIDNLGHSFKLIKDYSI